MAKIKWLHHPLKPELNGSTEHVAHELAVIACGYGQAELCPRPNYGTPEYLAERAETASGTLGKGSVDPNVKGIEWGLKEKSPSSMLSRNLIIKRVGAETFYYSAPPADCPLSIVERWNELVAIENPELAAERLEQAKNAQVARQEQEKLGVLAQIYK